jgi:hypothetical protein
MTPGFNDIIAAAEADRRDLFLSTSLRLGTPIQNVEKDFWVCWVLDLLFNGAGNHEPRLLFKGGTSLSKSHGLISRFSEDIDITVFREDLGQPVDVEDLEGLSGKKQRANLNAIKEACQRFIASTLKERLATSIASAFEKAGLPFNGCQIGPGRSGSANPAHRLSGCQRSARGLQPANRENRSRRQVGTRSAPYYNGDALPGRGCAQPDAERDQRRDHRCGADVLGQGGDSSRSASLV